MKNVVWAGLFFLAALLLTNINYSSYKWVPLFLAATLGYAFSRLNTLSKELQDLRRSLAKDWEARNKKEASSPSIDSIESEEPRNPERTQPKQEAMSSASSMASRTDESHDVESDAVSAPHHAKTETSSTGLSDPTAVEEPFFIRKIKETVTNYFTGGNLFVRVGIILLFFGVSFLLRYVSEQGLFPIEYRLISVAAAAIALLTFGWRLRTTKTQYALLLQGAAVGILYLTIFAAFSLYHLIPALPAFAILLIISLFTAALAILQNSQALALLGFSGGFLAPILASNGSNNHVGLFSYYIILNIALLVVAWFKAWRPLNLLGFLFTFIVSTAWGVHSYKTEKFDTTEPFLIVFFLMYVAIAVLFALRQPPKLKGYVDGSLLFGVPLAASGLQYSLVKNTEYGVALSALAFGLFYTALAWGMWKKAGDRLRLLAEAFLALGVIFTSLAIPFALDPSHTAAAWGLEGLGLIWLGSRQQRLSVRSFGLLLLVAAGIFVFIRHDYLQDIAFANGTFISTMMMAVASLFSARILEKPFEGKQSWEATFSPLLLIAGLLWLFGGFAQQIEQHYGSQWLTTSLLLLASVVSVLFTVVSKRTKPEWKPVWLVAIGLLPAMLLAAVTPLNGYIKIYDLIHPSQMGGWLVWPLAFAALYWVYRQLDQHNQFTKWSTPLHSIAALLFITLATWEGSWQLKRWLADSYTDDNIWNSVWLIIPALLALWTVVKNNHWPFKQHQNAYLRYTGSALAAYLGFWSLFALTSRGSAEVIPWMPILNPLDITLLIVLISIFQWWKTVQSEDQDSASVTAFINSYSHYILGALGVIAFAWLNFTLFRVMHHYFDVSYTAHGLFNSPMAQTSLSILWALLGVMLTIFASHRHLRMLWLIGGGLLILVVAKLFVIDLSEVGNLARIISFLVVGVLLTSIGYFAPIPTSDSEDEDQNLRRENN